MNKAYHVSRMILLGAVLATGVHPALADPVGGAVDPINTLTSLDYVDDISIVGASGLTNIVIVSGVINNNSEFGWDLQVTSTNLGVLRRGAGGAGRELAYNNIRLVRTSGTVGTGLTDPHNSVRNITTGANAGDVAGTTHFFTHTAFSGNGTATAATQNYAFELQITATADASLLSGSYSDNITLTLSNDS